MRLFRILALLAVGLWALPADAAIFGFVPGVACKSTAQLRSVGAPSVYLPSGNAYVYCPITNFDASADIKHVYVDVSRHQAGSSPFTICSVDIWSNAVSCQTQNFSATGGSFHVGFTSPPAQPTYGNLSLYTYLRGGANHDWLNSIRYDQ